MTHHDTPMTVGSLAALAGVTVRTLHHYDGMGLVRPSARSEAGYRLYDERDVDRLQEVLFFRELGFGLDEIRRILDDPGYRRADALRRQRELLASKAERLHGVIAHVDRALEAERTGMRLTPEEKLEVFGDFEPERYEQEARERWSDTDAYRESNRRVASYSKADWLRLRAEAAEINRAMLDLMALGVAADDPRATALAERHRAHITRWFYECSQEMHAALAEMYVGDARFRESIDRAGEGLAAYLAAAIRANAGTGSPRDLRH